MKTSTIRDGNYSDNVCYDFPNTCPICNKGIEPIEKKDYYNKDTNHISILFVCPSCNKGFVSHYILTEEDIICNGSRRKKMNLIGSFPKEPAERNFDNSIQKLSTQFCEIYNQAYKSEFYGLNELSGMGYRKSIEFLIKDYCALRNEEDSDKIKGMHLAQVIENYIDGQKLKNLSKASVWLGNDETHYIRKYTDKDIEDLKKFIDATVAFITYEITADEATEMINK